MSDFNVNSGKTIRYLCFPILQNVTNVTRPPKHNKTNTSAGLRNCSPVLYKIVIVFYEAIGL